MPAIRTPAALIVLLLPVCLAGISLTFRDYGITWDEGVQSRYGELALDYYASGMRDTSYENLYDLKYYGALFEMACSAVYRVAETDPYATRHFCIALTGLLTVVAVVLFGQLWKEPWIGVYAGLALLMIPRFYGHCFNNSKDIPFACAFSWAMLAIAWTATARRVSWRHIILTALAIGLALSVRMAGLLLFGFAAAVFAARAPVAFAAGRIRAVVLRGLSGIGIAWAVMVAGWPWAHRDALLNPWIAFRRNVDFELFKEILYAGEFVSSNDIPRSYLPWFLAITLPLPLIALAAGGLYHLVRKQLTGLKSTDRILGLVLQLWLFVPAIYFVISRPTVYDGIRHFLFLLPAVALLAAVGGARLRRNLPRPGWRAAATLLTFAAILWPAKDIVALHPYQSSYFNGLVGGVAGASDRYETDYWASSYKEAAAWINARAREAAGKQLRVMVAGNEYALPCIRHYSLSTVAIQMINLRGVTDPLPPSVDYYVATTRRRFDENFSGAPVQHRVGRAGATFAVIRGHGGR